MTNEERHIEETFGRQNPFRVPEGYFDQLPDRVMAQLPQSDRQSRQVRLRRWLYAAASVVLLAVMGLTYYLHQESEELPAVAAVEIGTDNSYIDDAADYAMIDNTEIYACLADN